MLSQAEAARYLLDRGLLRADSIVNGRVTVRDASSRNRNFKVDCSPGHSFLLKQGLSPEAAATVASEGGVYEFLSNRDGVRRYLPDFYGYDRERGVLVLELVTSGIDLRTYQQRRGRIGMGVARSLGRALASLHRATTFTDRAVPAPERAPFVFALHRPSSQIFRELSATSTEVIKIVQHAASLTHRLDAVRSVWSPSAVIHHDVKWDNLIIPRDPKSGRAGEVKLIDWEGAVQGDPCWDVGSVFSNFLSSWLFSIPITGQSPPENFPKLARLPLERMRPAIRWFWESYVKSAGLDRRSARSRLLRSVECAGARLVQTAFEAAQVSASLNGAIVLHLQLAQNVLDRTVEAAVQLLGLPFYEPVAR